MWRNMGRTLDLLDVAPGADVDRFLRCRGRHARSRRRTVRRGERGYTSGGPMRELVAASTRRKLTLGSSSTVLGGSLAVLFGMGSAGLVGCNTQQAGTEVTAATSQALVATLSGTISDTQGRPLANVVASLAGRTMGSQ